MPLFWGVCMDGARQGAPGHARSCDRRVMRVVRSAILFARQGLASVWQPNFKRGPFSRRVPSDRMRRFRGARRGGMRTIAEKRESAQTSALQR